ncbi:RNA polymerase sigma-70 factor [Desertivirga xinjiangensis]|uniref:RNA polymerase sigma-70 factor n=1 Tax=Desertivirga xinjiangensis TaxID=539206 RepID=UPI00210B6BCD|nr:RNA polymerase sigma-70 factor [Pedobacter xinjiangensis]
MKSFFSAERTLEKGNKTVSSLAFEQLFLSYYDRLVYFAWQFIHDKETARDIVQEAFVNYWKSFEFDAPPEVQGRNFLYLTVKNACLKIIRHDKVVDKHRQILDPDPTEESCTINKIIRAEVSGEIYRAIETLPASCRRISRMCYLEGMKNQEIADELGISVNTVKTQKQRALQLLRLRLNPEIFILLMLYFTND